MVYRPLRARRRQSARRRSARAISAGGVFWVFLLNADMQAPPGCGLLRRRTAPVAPMAAGGAEFVDVAAQVPGDTHPIDLRVLHCREELITVIARQRGADEEVAHRRGASAVW